MQKSDSFTDKTIGEIVAEDYRTAAVFEKHGIDFCCGGQAALSAICRQKGLDPLAIAGEIREAMNTPVDRSQNYTTWSMSFLADYIVNTHHVYLKENIGQIADYAHKIAKVHGAHHPEVVEIAAIFDRIAVDMAAHLREEEEVFFPAVKRVEVAQKANMAVEEKDMEIIRNSLEKFNLEHEEIGDATHRIHHLAKGYAVPDDVCNTFMLTYRKLKEFEDDLHKHVHLENNILFRKAAQLA